MKNRVAKCLGFGRQKAASIDAPISTLADRMLRLFYSMAHRRLSFKDNPKIEDDLRIVAYLLGVSTIDAAAALDELVDANFITLNPKPKEK